MSAALPWVLRGNWADAAEREAPSPSRTKGPARLNFNESPWGPSAKARQAMQEGIAECGRYPYPLQYRLIEEFARQNGLGEGQVQVFCGSKPALQDAVHAFTGPRSLVVADPSYEAPVEAAEARQAKVHSVPLDSAHGHDVEAMLAADPQAGLIYVCNPNNPTGTLTPHAAIQRLLARAPEHTVVLVDEAYIHFSDAPSCVPLVHDHPRLLVLRTFSKLYGMAGARLGLAIGQPSLLEALENLDGNNVAAAPTLHAGLASLADPLLIPHRKARNQALRDATVSRLAKAGWRCTASQSNCFMIDVRRPADPVVKALADRDVLVGRTWPSWPTWIRVTVGNVEEMQRFEHAFAEVVT